MKKIFGIYLLIISILCIIGILINIHIHMHPNVRKGDIWVKEFDTDNPFEEVKRDTLHIIDVKGDYCLYINNGDTISDTKHWTVICGRRIKKGIDKNND